MATVVLSGYYGYQNAGDEALLKAIITSLRRLRPDLRLIVLSGQPKLTRRDHGVIAVHRYNPLAVLAAIAQADLVISGGGSLLQDVTGRLTIPYYLLVVAVARLMGRKVMFYAQGIGPVRGLLGKLLIRLVADRVDLITLRDSASARRLKNMGVTRPPVRVTGDPVFALPFPKKNSGPTGSPEAVFCLREWPGVGEIAGVCTELALFLIKKGWRVTFLPLHLGEDAEFAAAMAAQVGPGAQVAAGPPHFENALEIIAGASLLVGVRLHALMFATLAGVPVVGISYDPKVAGFLEETSRPAFGVSHPLEARLLIAEADRILQDYEAEIKKARSWAGRLKTLAEENAILAIELIEGSGSGKGRQQIRRHH